MQKSQAFNLFNSFKFLTNRGIVSVYFDISKCKRSLTPQVCFCFLVKKTLEGKIMDTARQVFVLLSVLVLYWEFERCEASGKFSFEVHHMFSDKVKQSLGLDNLVPEKGSLEYFKLLAHRDRLIRGRSLASNNEETPVTFMGALYHANITVGTPRSSFLVALDTGSDLLWLPCNCGTTCTRNVGDAGSPQNIPLGLYTPNASSTSLSIRCSDNRCFGSKGCSSPASTCPYQIPYSNNKVTTGTLVQDVLHLATEDNDLKPTKANIILGCGQNLRSRAVNGVLGLGMKDYSVLSVLAKENIIANSFSMCLGRAIDGVGRISFGDKGYTDQEETPFVSVEPSTAYNVNVMEVSVEGHPIGVRLFAKFDSGSSFTHLKEPAYGVFTKAFDNLAKDKRRAADPKVPFEFCYDLSPNAKTISFPLLEMTFGGGSKMTLKNPLFSAKTKEGTVMYCLGVLKSVDLNIIGQNFMLGYRIVFDRERMVLGWKQSDCK